MKLKTMNKNLDKFGYPEILEYDNPDFHGHQKGIAIGIKDNKTNKFVRNYLSKELGDDFTRDFLLNDLVQDPEILLIENNITQMENDELVPRTIYYLPYFVEDHSCLTPTVNFDNISGACNVSYKAKVELLFATDDGLNRYTTIEFQTRNVSIFELINNAFDDNSEIPEIVYDSRDYDGENSTGYYLDFYDEAGEPYYLCKDHKEDYRDLLVSFRLIGLDMEIDNDNN